MSLLAKRSAVHVLQEAKRLYSAGWKCTKPPMVENALWKVRTCEAPTLDGPDEGTCQSCWRCRMDPATVIARSYEGTVTIT